MTDDLELITSEAVTNALVHAGSGVDVRIRFPGGSGRPEMRNEDTAPPYSPS
ncbi:hypothetical protein ACFTXM_44805 [Streptomyces sp. NPDC056930]|uniref:hypothetical protein n=1 Tax=Streptomyces sp. NPDC056930 TaxID=3345967 RepID=UPI003643EBAF